jgi:phosphoenolpyruvate---glycerone phosphotransferase subunit DhaL
VSSSIQEATVDALTIERWLRASAAALKEQRDYLTQLDAAIGDADHGTNMDRGFTAVLEKLDGLEEALPPGRLLTTAGGTLISKVGGASGPLWGTALRRAGRALGDAEEFDGPALAAAFEAALDGVVELGAAQMGDKTMVDALLPAVRTFRGHVEDGAGVAEALTAAREAAEEGMRATVPLQASKGRASYLGERSIGHQDPGATSTVLIIAALEQAVTER